MLFLEKIIENKIRIIIDKMGINILKKDFVSEIKYADKTLKEINVAKNNNGRKFKIFFISKTFIMVAINLKF